MRSESTNAIVFHEPGGADVLKWEPQPLTAPQKGEVRLRHTAIGINFIDVYDRTGQYPRKLPAVPGREAAGVIEGVGPGVRDFKKGQRVAYVAGPGGAYCERRNIATRHLVKIPAGVSDEQAACLMLKGLTAEFLLRRAHRVQKGEHLLVYAAAGGAGSMITQWARALGAKVMGVVGNDEKAAIAKKQGCHVAFVLGRDDLVESVRKFTKGRMADVVYDSVGKDTFMTSLDCLRPRGLMVTFGNASGPVAPFAPLELARRGSLMLTRPTLFDYIKERSEYHAAARAMFAVLRSRKLKVNIGQRYPLREAAQAHRDLEGRRTIGATVLMP
jgi:NADPH:quinone reductase